MDHNSERYIQLGKAALEFENDICEIECMANIVTERMSGVSENNPSGTVVISEKDANTNMFAVYHLEAMIADFRAKYYSALKCKS